MPLRPPPRTETIRFLTLDELGRLLAATRESVRDRALFLLAYRHGLRASEVGLPCASTRTTRSAPLPRTKSSPFAGVGFAFSTLAVTTRNATPPSGTGAPPR